MYPHSHIIITKNVPINVSNITKPLRLNMESKYYSKSQVFKHSVTNEIFSL